MKKNLFKPNIYDREDPKTDMKNMPLNRLCFYAMDHHDFFDYIQGKELISRGGSAVIQGQSNAFGIPTGHIKGFASLEEILVMYDGRTYTTVKALVNLAFHFLRQKIMNGQFTSVVWPAQFEKGKYKWGHSIFEVGDDVRDYITSMIDILSQDQDVINKLTPPIVHDLIGKYELPK
jgi:hypothetical protein